MYIIHNGHSTMVSMPAFQAGDRCSIPLVRNLLKFDLINF